MDNKLLAWGEKELTTAGISNALMESLWLLRSAKDDAETFEKSVRERKNGKPLAYILGTQEFEGLTFKVNDSVLIPRQETMVLISEALDRLKKMPAPKNVLDVGTGSGNVAISLALGDKEATITATDLSDAAIEMAKENASTLKVSDRISFMKSDILDSVKGKFDMIVSNPPYIKTDDIPHLQREIQHEPHMSLDGGPDGLRLIEKLARQAREFINPQGYLLMEVAYNKSPDVVELLKNLGYVKIHSCKDDAGLGRVVIGQQP